MSPARRAALALLLPVMLAGCGALQRMSEIGRAPGMTPSSDPTRDPSWRPMTMPMPGAQVASPQANSLWRTGSRAFFKDQRAAQVGDIVTILIATTDSANVQDNTTTSRASDGTLGVPNLFGLEKQIPHIMGGSTPASLVSTSSGSGTTGKAQMQRSEAVTVSLAGVITQVLPNGNLVVSARQEMRVNHELRELQVTGVIRPQDIASDNTVAHDRMAEARISYGGRGELTEVQATPWGQQLLNIIMPF